MLERLLPSSLKQYLKEGIRRAAVQQRQEPYWPYAPDAECYMLPKNPPSPLVVEQSKLPVPPQIFWAGYGDSAEKYLAGGKIQIAAMREICAQHGVPVESSGRILEFGCSAGRMMRWLEDLAGETEIWGVDISAERICWCQQYLSPPFHFATTTTNPHLPFEDHYFGFIFAGSVFTHIDDLAMTWFLELRRILCPGGALFITIHDSNTVDLLQNKFPDHSLARSMRQHPEYCEYVQQEFGMFTIKRSVDSQVFYDVEYLKTRLEPFFRMLSVNLAVYGYQSGILLQRLPT